MRRALVGKLRECSLAILQLRHSLHSRRSWSKCAYTGNSRPKFILQFLGFLQGSYTFCGQPVQPFPPATSLMRRVTGVRFEKLLPRQTIKRDIDRPDGPSASCQICSEIAYCNPIGRVPEFMYRKENYLFSSGKQIHVSFVLYDRTNVRRSRAFVKGLR